MHGCISKTVQIATILPNFFVVKESGPHSEHDLVSYLHCYPMSILARITRRLVIDSQKRLHTVALCFFGVNTKHIHFAGANTMMSSCIYPLEH